MRIRALFVAAAAVVACESATEPGADGRLPVGPVVSGLLGGADSVRTFVVTGDSAGWISLLARAEGQGFFVEVRDSTRHQPVGGGFVLPLTPPQEVEVASFETASSQTVYAVVIRSTAATPSPFTLRATRTSLLPENRAGSFAIGDTVSGESIGFAGDQDLFTTHGVAGETVVVMVELLAPPPHGLLGLSVRRPDLGSVGGVTVAPFLTGIVAGVRLGFPSSGAFTFRFRGLEPGPYAGAYRFWTYVINPAPEQQPVAAPLNTIISEAIARPGDVDEFTFTLAAPTDVNIFLQSAAPIWLTAGTASGAPFGNALANVADTNLFGRFTNRFTAPAGTHRLRVSGQDLVTPAEAGAYRFYIYTIDPRPEARPAVLPAGDTVVGESIGLPGDVDEFTFAGLAGQEFTVALQAQDGSPQTRLELTVFDANGSVRSQTGSTGTDTGLTQGLSDRFAMATSGTHRVRIQAGQFAPGSKGPYRLTLTAIDPRPETRPAALALGDSILGESLDVPGDVDRFHVHVTDTIGVNLWSEYLPAPGSGQSVTAQLVDSATGTALGGATSTGTGNRIGTGRLVLTPATYTVRVTGTRAARGGYRVWLYPFSLGPETANDTIAVGDTVSGEAIDPIADGDRYWFFATRGDHINIMLQGQSSAAPGGFGLHLAQPLVPFLFLNSPGSAAALSDNQTMRIDLERTGWYSIAVGAAGSPPGPATGAYRVAVVATPHSPEIAGAALAVGDSVGSETIGTPGDLDRFVVTGTPGQDISFLFGSASPGPRYPSMHVFDPATRDTLAQDVGQGRRLVGPVRIPAGGQVWVEVAERLFNITRECFGPTCNNVFSYAGDFNLKVIGVNRAPEVAATAYVLGDTVRTESIGAVGDIDEFTATGTPGQVLSAWWRLQSASVPAGSLISLTIVDPATGAVLAGSGAYLFGSVEFRQVGPFTVPAGGSYIIRVKGGGSGLEPMGTAPYEFTVRPGS